MWTFCSSNSPLKIRSKVKVTTWIGYVLLNFDAGKLLLEAPRKKKLKFSLEEHYNKELI